MSAPHLKLFENSEQVSQAGADEFVRLAKEAIAARGRFVVALAGGSTPKRLYQLLAESPRRELVAWDKVEFFWGDERSLPPTHADSNFRMANDALLSKLPLRPEQVHRMEAERADSAAVARDYQATIAQVLGAGSEPPAFDLVLVGMGPDGHTLSLFPHTTALEEQSAWVVANYVQKFTTTRITFTPKLANQARNIVFLVAGPDKAPLLAEVLGPKRDTGRLPSQLLQPTTGKLVWFVDRAAAASCSHLFPTPGSSDRIKIAPSILSADFARLGAHVKEAEQAGADRVHVDVMDGQFVANITIGPCVVESLRKVTALPLECHLMIDAPERYLEDFAAAGADTILVHYEGAAHLHRTLQRIRSLGKRNGVVINPATSDAVISEVLADVDMVLVMTVNPGFGGQKFIESTLPKIRRLRDRLNDVNPACEIEVDGGVDPTTAGRIVAAGAGVLVAGSAVFHGKDGVAAAMQKLREAAHRG